MTLAVDKDRLQAELTAQHDGGRVSERSVDKDRLQAELTAQQDGGRVSERSVDKDRLQAELTAQQDGGRVSERSGGSLSTTESVVTRPSVDDAVRDAVRLARIDWLKEKET